MAKNLDRVVVVDVESTCWKGTPPAGEEAEIIEIGVCLLEVASGERVERESILVKPERSKVSAFCTELTTLTQADVDRGVSFKDACAALKKKHLADERTWASWGDYDRRAFERECASKKVRSPFGPTHLNAKSLFALIEALPHEVGMAEALERLGLPLEGTHHRGGDDAWNIALILSRVLHAARKGRS